MSNVPELQPDTADTSLGKRLRHQRTLQQMTLRALAESCGLSAALLSQIERGVSSPSLRSLRVICSSLNMPMGELFTPGAYARDNDEPLILRKNARRYIDLGAKGVYKELITPKDCNDIQMMLIVISPGGGSGDEPFYSSTGSKAGTVLEGVLGLEIDGQSHFLQEGDSFAFDAQRRIRWWCASQCSCRLFWVTTPAIY